ncbi:MAG: sugar phosphate isomerase/epimerase [Clostridiales bacterium]|nr:sugar phosphate isomerase/epimerase [Clostridiales bacterium]
MYKVGLSVGDVDGLVSGAVFKGLKAAEISAVEISVGMPRIQELDYKKIKKNAGEYGIRLWSYHLPFMPFEELDISSTDKQIRDFTVEFDKELIRKAADIGIDKFVIHPSGEPIEDSVREDAMKYSKQSLSELADFAAERGAVIAVEDLPRSCLGHNAEEILRLISANDKLRVCFDTNHLLLDNNKNFMDMVGDKIITIHVSDYDYINERHWLPGEGKLDWDMMTDKLEKIGYNGIWMYEIGLKTPKTIIRSRELEYKDFADNAIAVFNHEKPPFLGTPKPNLGMWE